MSSSMENKRSSSARYTYIGKAQRWIVSTRGMKSLVFLTLVISFLLLVMMANMQPSTRVLATPAVITPEKPSSNSGNDAKDSSKGLFQKKKYIYLSSFNRN